MPVWFTAWRYEREPHLIVPLLDVLREELDRRAGAADAQNPARRAAKAIARAGRAFLAGLTVTAGVPGLTAQWEPEKVITALRSDEDAGTESLSFHRAGFVLLRDAIREFSAGGTRRVVVFVDDLDRCLPANALVARNGRMDADQLADFNDNVREHLTSLARTRSTRARSSASSTPTCCS